MQALRAVASPCLPANLPPFLSKAKVPLRSRLSCSYSQGIALVATRLQLNNTKQVRVRLACCPPLISRAKVRLRWHLSCYRRVANARPCKPCALQRIHAFKQRRQDQRGAGAASRRFRSRQHRQKPIPPPNRFTACGSRPIRRKRKQVEIL